VGDRRLGKRKLELMPSIVRGGRTWGSPVQRVLLLATALMGASATVAVLWLRHLGAVGPTTSAHWWLLALGFLGTEILVIHVDMRRDTYSISMMELPLVAGLFFASPIAVLTARLAGSAAAVVVNRRQVPIKVAFNFALYAAETVAAVVVFRAISGDVTAVDPHAWLAAAIAMLAANAVSVSGVMLAMYLHGADLTGRVRAMLGGAVIPPVANTSLALAAVTLLWIEPRSAWLLGAIALVLVAAYRSYTSLNRRYANLQRLYDFTRRTNASGDGVAVTTLLKAAAELMRADHAMLAVRDDGAIQITSVGEGADAERRVTADELDGLIARVFADPTPVLVPRSPKTDGDRMALAATKWRDCILVPITSDDQVWAVMAVADRSDDVSTFDHEDLRLFEALVNHSAVALDNAHLVGRLRHDALHDTLTGLPNRAMFRKQVDEAIRSRPPGVKLALMLMDLDRFKEVNDTLGHHHGDRLLGEVGNRLADVIRRGGGVARLGGDEFGLLLPGVADAEEALVRARDVRDLLRAPFELGDLHVDVNGTIGIAIAPDHGEDASTLLQRADVAMYAAKQGAGIELYTSERDHYSPRRLALIGELREAIDHGDLVLHYQPKVDLVTGMVVGAEALVRWQHPVRGLIPPDEFIPIAEHTGIIRSLTLCVVRQALSDCARWRTTGYELSVAVNVSARNLLDVDLMEQLRALLAGSALPPGLLTLEITESSILGDTNRTMAVLEELAHTGVRISIDDFGTGYSSLTLLKHLPVDEVKIDKSFVQAMESDPGDAAIVRSVIDLCANLGMTVVAEGVENASTLDLLSRLSCPVAQGYLISRPVPFDELTGWLATTPTYGVICTDRDHSERLPSVLR
jgi:diguanylate cyclase (GGDEF)-like protein